MHGVVNPRLMLQEANLLREWVQRNEHDVELAAKDKTLVEAGETLREALKIVKAERRQPGLEGNLLTELARTTAKRAEISETSGAQKWDVAEAMTQIEQLALEAHFLLPDSFHPIEVLLRAADNFGALLSEEQRIRTEVEVVHAFDSVELEDLSPEQYEHYLKARHSLARFLGNSSLEEATFAELKRTGSAAGYYLRARRMVGVRVFHAGQTTANFSSDEQALLKTASDYLLSNWEQVNEDSRCMELLLRCWWGANTGKRLFFGERQTVALSRELWAVALRILDQISASEHVPPRLTYLRGLALFHLKRQQESIEVFHELETEMISGRRRIVRSYLLSEADGTPTTFSGTVDWVRGRQGGAWVPELQRTIPFLTDNFARRDLGKGASLASFHIAFNFLGPVVDPLAYYKEGPSQ